MGFALILFLLGTMTYRFCANTDETSPFVRIGSVFVKAARNWRNTLLVSLMKSIYHLYSQRPRIKLASVECFLCLCHRFLNKALVAPDGLKEEGKICSISEVEEAKAVLRLFPIWATCLAYAIVYSQASTLFTKQGVSMDRSISPSFEVPAASLQSFISLSIVVFIPIYDRILVPIARAMTRKLAGITMLQQIGIGLFLSCISMVVAAPVEMKRLDTAQEYGLIDKPSATVRMNVAWLIPQYVLLGVSESFTMVGLQEFFYDQVPSELKSIGLALYLSIFGIGSFLSGFLISIIEKATGGDGRDSWFSNNLNKAHLDYFYWLLATLSAVALIAYLYFAKSCIYSRGSNI